MTAAGQRRWRLRCLQAAAGMCPETQQCMLHWQCTLCPGAQDAKEHLGGFARLQGGALELQVGEPALFCCSCRSLLTCCPTGSRASTARKQAASTCTQACNFNGQPKTPHQLF